LMCAGWTNGWQLAGIVRVGKNRRKGSVAKLVGEIW